MGKDKRFLYWASSTREAIIAKEIPVEEKIAIEDNE